jgi:hypothetical protein
MFKRFARNVRRIGGAVAVAAGLACSAPSHAIIVVGLWDPAFGPAFPQLGWRGEAKYFVPDSCFAESGFIPNSAGCSALGMKLLSAQVNFYSLSDPQNASLQETLFFNVPSTDVAGVYIDDGVMTGVLGSFGYFRPSTLALAGAPYTDFMLLFDGDIALLKYVSSPVGSESSSGFSEPTATITFTAVPEPGSLALLLLAVGTIGVVVRQRAVVAPRARR